MGLLLFLFISKIKYNLKVMEATNTILIQVESRKHWKRQALRPDLGFLLIVVEGSDDINSTIGLSVNIIEHRGESINIIDEYGMEGISHILFMQSIFNLKSPSTWTQRKLFYKTLRRLSLKVWPCAAVTEEIPMLQ